jgi:hypothetical protein
LLKRVTTLEKKSFVNTEKIRQSIKEKENGLHMIEERKETSTGRIRR